MATGWQQVEAGKTEVVRAQGQALQGGKGEGKGGEGRGVAVRGG